MEVNSYQYDGKFEGNILVLGQRACRKTTFILNFAKNKLFGNIKDVTWLTKITFSKNREENIRSCFDVQVNFAYPQNISEFDYLIENFQRNKKTDYGEDDNVIGQGNKFVLDNVSGLADKSDIFASFLTVARKFNFTVVYVFQPMYPSKQNYLKT